MKLRLPFPMWLKIVAAALIVQVLVLIAIGYTSIALLNQALLQQNELRVNELRPLLNANLSNALFQRDIAGIRTMLRAVQREEGIRYLWLVDENHKFIAAAGKVPVQKLEPRISVVKMIVPEVIDNVLPIEIGKTRYGTLHFGLSTEFAQRAQQHMIERGFIVAAITEVIAFFLLLMSGLQIFNAHLLVRVSLRVICILNCR